MKKSGLKTGGHSNIFWVLQVKKSLFMVFLAQKLIHIINLSFNVVFGSFFEQDHQLKLFISGVYAKRWSKCAGISIQKLI